jgi:hypothetical protein
LTLIKKFERSNNAIIYYEKYKKMNKFLQTTLIVLSIWFIPSTALIAKKTGDPVNKKTIEPTDPLLKKISRPAAKRNLTIPAEAVLKQEALAALNSQLQGLSLTEQNPAFRPSAAFLKEPFLSKNIVSNRDSATALFKKLDAKGYLDGDKSIPSTINLVKMPIGIKKHFGANNIVYVGFTRAVIKPTHAELTAFVKMEMYVQDGQTGTKKKKEIFFGAEGIKLTNNGKIVGDARLVLLGDYNLPMFNGKMNLILRGGKIDDATGGILNGNFTFAVLNCDGFKEVGILADAIFDRQVIVPIDPKLGTKKTGNVQATLKIGGGVTDFNDIMGKLTFKTGFAITGHEKWGFSVDEMFFDASNVKNLPDITYLNKYINDPNHKADIGENLNEWRGLGLNNFRLFLPSEFKKKSTTNRIAIAVNNLIFDKYGVSCDIGVENISNFKLDSGKTTSVKAWKMSLDRFYLTFDQSKLAGGKFGGKILLPVSNADLSAYSYNAIIDLKGKYELTVSTLKEVDFSIFKAKAVLSQASVSLTLMTDPNDTSKDVFVPKATLSGYMSLKPTEIKKDSTKETVENQKSDQRVTFQNLVITNTSPYFALESAGYANQSEMVNFPVTVSNFNVSITNNGNNCRAILSGGVNLNLMGGSTDTSSAEGFSVKSNFKLEANLITDGEYHKWEYKGMSIKPAGINATIGSYKFVGKLDVFNDPPGKRGSGFESLLQFSKKEGTAWKLLGSFQAIFGNIKEKDTRYWLVEGYANVPLFTFPGIKLQGFGMGVYHHLYPGKSSTPGNDVPIVSTNNFGPTVPAVNYILSDNKLGFKAVVGMESTDPKRVIKGMVGLEVIFNAKWGLASIGLFGNAVMAAEFVPALKTPAFATNLTNKFSSMATKATDNKVGEILTKSKFIDKGASEFNEGATEKTSQAGQVALNLAVKMDFEQNQLHGDGDVFINVGPMKGIYENGRAGKFVFHFDKKEWYVHVGNPTERNGVGINLGLIMVKTSAYFMVGHRIPPMPPPPPQILALLGPNYTAATPSRDESAIATGKGIAFGADINMNTGQMRAAIFYAQMQAGAGLDVMMSKGNHSCAGIDGWYARGQAYAYITADVGITLKVGFIRKNISIFNGAAGVLLQAGLPNPAWFRGHVAGRYAVLGGKIKGDFHMKMSLGNECGNAITYTPPNDYSSDNSVDPSLPDPNGSIVNISNARLNANQYAFSVLDIPTKPPGQALVNSPIVLSFTPSSFDSVQVDNDTSVQPATPIYSSITESVFTIPTFTFNHAIDKDFAIINASGVAENYKFVLKNASIMALNSLNSITPTTLLWNDDKTVLSIQPNSVLNPSTRYKVKVDVQLTKAGVDQTGDKNVKDLREIIFLTGDAEHKITANNIAYMYPVDGQRFLYKNENVEGYIKLKRNQPTIASGLKVNDRKVKFVSEINEIEVIWKIQGDSISFPIPTNLVAKQKYKMFLTGFKEGLTKDSLLVIYQGEFRTSNFNTVTDKWNSLSNVLLNSSTFLYKTPQKQLTKNTLLMYANLGVAEWFDETELVGNNLTGFEPLINAKAKLNENYFTNSVNPLIYSTTAYTGINTNLSTFAERQNEVLVSNKYVNYAKHLNLTDSLKKWLPFEYSVTNLVHRDYLSLRNAVSEKYITDGGFLAGASVEYKVKAEALMSEPVPYLQAGNYNIDIYKKIPNRNSTFSKSFVYNLGSVTDDRGYSNITYNAADTKLVSNIFNNLTIENICSLPLTKILTTSKILQGAIIKMRASLEITMDEGFETFEDVDFEAEIGPCIN